MPRQPYRSPITGRRRRVPQRHATPKARSVYGLYTAEVGLREGLQKCTLYHNRAANRSLQKIRRLLLIKLVLNRQQEEDVSTSTAIITLPSSRTSAATSLDCLLRIEGAKYRRYIHRITKWVRLDHQLFDVSPLDETRVFVCKPWRDLRLGDLSEEESLKKTGFRYYELVRIYKCFGLREYCRSDGSNVIGCSNRHMNPSGRSQSRYLFHPEELFLFMMIKCRTGDTITELVDNVFGGEYNRWSYGYPWILKYIDHRYRNIIGHQGLLRYLKDFPKFHEAIKHYVTKAKVHHRNDGGRPWRSPGLSIMPHLTCMFVDCSITDSDVANSGPDGDYEGAPRKPRAAITNEALYTRFRHTHGLKVETAHLPNGITTVFGPVSCRRQDVGPGVLRASHLDDFLRLIQQDEPVQYTAFGDLAYGALWLQCIGTYFEAFGDGTPLTVFEKVCNYEFKRARQRIEFDYGDRNNNNKIMQGKFNFRLGKQHPYAIEQVRVCHLLTNIYNCLHGNKSSSYDCFRCDPPLLEDYLNID